MCESEARMQTDENTVRVQRCRCRWNIRPTVRLAWSLPQRQPATYFWWHFSFFFVLNGSGQFPLDIFPQDMFLPGQFTLPFYMVKIYDIPPPAPPCANHYTAICRTVSIYKIDSG